MEENKVEKTVKETAAKKATTKKETTAKKETAAKKTTTTKKATEKTTAKTETKAAAKKEAKVEDKVTVDVNVNVEARATLSYARISARKVKIVADLIRGKSAQEALSIVKFAPKASSEIIEKLLKSAIANAENNHFMKSNDLYVAEIYANQGPTLKRIRPAAKGSAVRIRKRTSHITIVLRECKLLVERRIFTTWDKKFIQME